MLIDTHAHLNFNAFKDDSDEVIRRALDNNIWMINVGSQYTTSKRAVEIAEKYEKGVYAAVGLHPIHLTQGIFKTKIDAEEAAFQTREEEFEYEKYKNLAQSKKVIAIGEIGLDYYYRPKTKTRLEQFKEKQRTVLCKQLDLARELNLPVIFHCRSAHEDLILTIQHSNIPIIRGVIHCFTGTWQEAQKYLEMGFYLGFNGIIFKLDLDEVIKKTPLDKILIETDCPYLTPPLPASLREQARLRSVAGGRNEPLYIKYVVEKIAELKNEKFDKVAEITTQNARDLFRI